MSELKAISGHEIREDIDYNTRGIDPEDKEWRNYGKELCDTLYYRKSEADKVIAELEESHKKEVEQLLLTILELKEKLAAPQLVMRLNSPEALYSDLETMGRLSHKIHVVERRELHHKYKRCVSNAELCSCMQEQCGFLEIQKWEKREKKWRGIAEKLKESK